VYVCVWTYVINLDMGVIILAAMRVHTLCVTLVAGMRAHLEVASQSVLKLAAPVTHPPRP